MLEMQERMNCEDNGQILTSLSPKENYWRTHSTSTLMEECPMEDACVGGNGTWNSLCNEGYKDPLCSVCSSDYFFSKASNSCLECSQSSFTSFSFILLSFLSVVVVVLMSILIIKPGLAESLANSMTKKALRGEESEEHQEKRLQKIQSKVKILFTFFQIISSYQWILDVSFPSPSPSSCPLSLLSTWTSSNSSP